MAKFSLFALATWVGLAAAKDVYLNWHIGWVNASPDGFERPVIGINGQWPCPQIDVNVGDQLIVDVYNGLGNESTAIHWHGMRQQGSGVMDGAVGVTQCPIAPGSHMQYHFDVNQAGTYWYHSHNMGQYPDGLRGALIVHDPSPPFHYDDEFTITLSDWYHKEMPELLDAASVASHGQEPLPDSALINDSTNTKIKVLPNKTYLVHIICIGNWPGHFWVLDGHEMTVVEVDGVYTEPHPAGDKFLRVATGQRMGVLIKTKPDASQNFAIWDTMDVNMMFIFENRTIPEGYNPNATAWLVYDEDKPLPEPPVFQHIDFQNDFVDDVTLVPADHEPLLQPVNQQIILETGVGLIDGVPRFTVNGKTYISPKVPSLYTANTIGPEFSSNPEVYGQVNPFVVKHNDVVEIVINNHHSNLHPWHLHGHQFQVLQRTPVDGGYYNGLTSNVSATPIRRDTIMVQNNGHAVIRFRADNPGVWMLHCHIEWHVEAGLMATIIEAPETFANTVHAPPKSHYDTCAAYPQDISGNAAGNDGLDLTGLDTKATAGSHGALYTATKGAKRPATAHPSQQSTQAPVANPPAPKAQPQAPQPALPNDNHEQLSTQAPVANPPAPKAQPQAPQPALPNDNHEQPSTQAPVANPPAPKAQPQAQPQAPKPALPNYNHEQPSAAPRPTAEPVNVDAGNTNDYWSAPHTAETHDHHVTIHEESTKGPLPNQNTHSGYVIDNGHSYPIEDASYEDTMDDLEDWE